jgi:hypothetical protein
MRIALIDIKVGTKIGCNFTAVNMRNMILLQKELGADFYYSTDQLKNNNQRYDAYVFGFSSVNSNLEETVEWIIRNNEHAPRLIRFVGEYEQGSPHVAMYYLLKRTGWKFDMIRNVDRRMGAMAKWNDRQFFVNINLLVSRQPNELTPKKYDCIYYGRWREGREKYFKRYIQEGMYLSTSTKNMKKFKHAGCNPKYLDTMSWDKGMETLNLFRYSLYIEDEYTHNVFNHLANRWYEAGFCNNVMFFDINCWNTIRKSEIGIYENEIKDYIVTDYNSLQDKINECNKDFNKHLAIQKTWRINEMLLRDNMINQLNNIITQCQIT